MIAQNDSPTKCDSTFYTEFTKISLLLNETNESVVNVEKLLSFNPNNAYGLYLKACSFLLKKEDEEALIWFKKSFDMKVLSSSFVKKDKVLNTIRLDFKDNKAFKQLLKDIK